MAAVLLAAHPVGSYYTSDDPTDPHDLFGGTWARIKGKVIVGLDEAQVEFDTANETGGEKTHQLTVAELAAHGHTGNTGANNASHSHGVPFQYATTTTTSGTGYRVTDIANAAGGGGTARTATSNGQSANHGHAFTTDNNGGNAAHNNLQPYIVAYMWKRTA